jgi:hypothetical protein
LETVNTELTLYPSLEKRGKKKILIFCPFSSKEKGIGDEFNLFIMYLI